MIIKVVHEPPGPAKRGTGDRRSLRLGLPKSASKMEGYSMLVVVIYYCKCYVCRCLEKQKRGALHSCVIFFSIRLGIRLDTRYLNFVFSPQSNVNY